MLVREAARKQQEGLTIEELAAWVEEKPPENLPLVHRRSL